MVFEICRKRDFIFVLIVLITSYLCLDSNNYSYVFEPAWYIDQKNSNLKIDKTLLPIITDLDGDGDKEILLVTNNFELKVLSGNTPRGHNRDIYIPDEKSSYELLPRNRNKDDGEYMRHPAAVNTGYITHYNNRKERQQVIVVLRNDLSVLCLDYSLNLLWEKQLAHKLHDIPGLLEHYDVHDVHIRILPLTINEGFNDGSIIIGLSMLPRDANSEVRIKLESGLFSTDPNEASKHVGINVQSQLQHFTVYALDAHNGTVIWKHDGVDVKPEQYIRSLPQHAFKLDVGQDIANKLHMSHAHGMNDWTIFRQSLFAELPHLWREPFDTNIRIAHFVRRHLGAGAGNQVIKPQSKSNTKEKETIDSIHIHSKTDDKKYAKKGAKLNLDLGRFTGVETPPLSLSASLPHDALEHTLNPNVLVAHTSQGIEVVSLTTGTPITALSLSKGHAYGDLDGDGIIDVVSILETQQDVAQHSITMLHDNENLQHCMVVVTSGLPPQSQLFNGSICPTRRHLHDPLTRRNGVNLPLAIKAAQPIIFRGIDTRTLKESKRRDLAIAVNHGVMTCYSGTGQFLWQIDNTPTWPIEFEYYYAGLYDSNARRVEESGTVDNLKANLVVMGDRSFSLVSREGHLLTVTDLPSSPRARPVIGDFNNDGFADIIIVTEDSILGYRLDVTESVNMMLVCVGLLFVIAFFSFVMNIRTVMDEDSSSAGIGEHSSTPLGTVNVKQKKSILTLIRSTDEHHID